jgi:hypothetical protein
VAVDQTTDSRFDGGDRVTIVVLCVIFLVVVSLFFVFIYLQGLTSYPPDRIEGAVAGQKFDYFAYALEYRERRLTLSLTLRTFITSLGFIVGLVLAVIGGIFILRRALVDFSASASGIGGFGRAAAAIVPVVPVVPVAPLVPVAADADPAAGAPAAAANPAPATPVADAVRGASFALATNSPGLVFMLAGVVVIYVTQLLAIQIGAPEIFPANSRVLCDAMESAAQTCTVADTPTQSAALDKLQVLLKFCEGNQTENGCPQLQGLVDASGVDKLGGAK